MTEFNALGASFGAFFGFPPGWYWYLYCSCAALPSTLSFCHGMLPAAMLTLLSEVADVGFLPGEVN
jgi:hypothetical protein